MMDYEEFKRQLGKAGISIKNFADLLGLNSKSVSNYSQGRNVPTHLAVIAVLMGEMAEHQLDYKTVIERSQLKPKKNKSNCESRFRGSKQALIG